MVDEDLHWDEVWFTEMIDETTHVAIASSIDTKRISFLHTSSLSSWSIIIINHQYHHQSSLIIINHHHYGVAKNQKHSGNTPHFAIHVFAIYSAVYQDVHSRLDSAKFVKCSHKPSLTVCNQAYPEPVHKPGNREGCSRKGNQRKNINEFRLDIGERERESRFLTAHQHKNRPCSAIDSWDAWLGLLSLSSM